MSSGSRDDFDPELDLLRRYEEMIQTQIQTINGIDDKAAYTARLIGIFGGLVLAAVSFAVTTTAFEVSQTTAVALVLVGLGIVALLVSLVFAIMTYLSSKFVYGPSTGLGLFLANYTVDHQEYRNALLRGYSAGIKANREVVNDNSRRFKRSLAAFLAGLLLLSGSGTLLIVPSNLFVDTVLGLAFGSIALLLGMYILREDYLALQERH